MVETICDFLNGCGFVGVGVGFRFWSVGNGNGNIYSNIDIVINCDNIIGYVRCCDTVSVFKYDYSKKYGCFDISDPELFMKLKAAVGEIINDAKGLQ